MTNQEKMRGFISEFCEAIRSRDASRLRPLLADNVEWAIFGPVDYFPFFGHRRGKEEVIEAMCRQIADHLHLRTCNFERMLFDGDSAASMVGMTAEHVATGRVIAFRLAQFIRFSNGKLVEMRAILDSFDVVEQMARASHFGPLEEVLRVRA
jgi:ketosteroid isomerase-like protein